MEHAPIAPSPPDTAEREYSLFDVIFVLLRRWKLMTAVAAIAPLLTLVYMWNTSLLWRGEAVLQTPTVSLSEYKRYSVALADRDGFSAFLGNRKVLTQGEIDEVRARIPVNEGIFAWVRPAFAFTKGDVKDVPDIAKLENQFVGADILVEERSEALTGKLVVAVGEYVADAVIRGRILDYVTPKYNDTRIALAKLENEFLQQTFLLAQQQKRLDDMRDIARRYPEASRESSRQVVSLEKGGARYFSPVTQLVGVESHISELNELLRKLSRDREKLESDLAFFALARSQTEKAPFGDQRLAMLEKSLVDAYKERDVKRDAVRESFNAVRMDVGQIRYIASDGMRFVSPPVVRKPSYRRLALATLAATVGGLVIALGVSLAVAWWQGGPGARAR